MYIKNDIAYADNKEPLIKIISVRPVEDHKLWVKFSDGEERIFDFSPLLSSPCFKPLNDKAVFEGVYIDCGVPVWDNGNIDIAPERIYEDGEKYST